MIEQPNKLISSRGFSYFLQLADTLNYTKAAQLLGITQPALTQQIKKLEGKLNSPLFYSSGKHLQLTKAGLILRESVETIYDVLAETTEKIGNENSMTHGKITIGISASVEDRVFTSFIIDYFKEYPDIEVTLLMVGRNEVWRFLEKNKIDLAILYLPNNVLAKWREYESRSILKDELLFLHHDEAISQQHEINLADTLSYQWVTYPKNYFVSQVISEAFDLETIKLPESVAHFTKPVQMFRFSNETKVSTALPRSFYEAHRENATLYALSFSPPIVMDLAFVYRKEKIKVPRINHFLEEFTKYVTSEDYTSRLYK